MPIKKLVGTDTNQLPRNKDLGPMAFQDLMSITGGALVNQITNTTPARPSLLFDFANAKTVDSRLYFSRGSTASYVNSSGRIAYAALNQPRIDHDPTTLKCKGLLIEEARTNLCTSSQDLSQGTNGLYGNWNPATVSTDTAVAPDGTTTADTFFAQSPTATRHFKFSATAGTTYTFSMYIKRNPASNDTNLWQFCVEVGWSADGTTLSGYTGIALNAHTLPQGVWTRVSASYTCPAGMTSMQMGPSNGGQGSAGDQLYSIFVWGCQIEAGSYPTSYIQTSGATATRSADVAQVAWNGINSQYSSVSGDYTLIFNFINTYNSGGNSPRILYSPNNSTFYAFNSMSGQDAYGTFYGNGNGITATGRKLGLEQKTAYTVYSLNSTTGGYYQSVAANGQVQQSQSYQTPYGAIDLYNANYVQLGGGNVAGQGTAGVTWITKFAYYPFRLSDVEIAEMTQI